MPVLCSIKERIAGHLIIEKPLIYKYFYPYIYCISIAITRMSTFNHCFSSFIIAGSGDALVPDKAIDSPNSFGDEGVPSPSLYIFCNRLAGYREVPLLCHDCQASPTICKDNSELLLNPNLLYKICANIVSTVKKCYKGNFDSGDLKSRFCGVLQCSSPCFLSNEPSLSSKCSTFGR